MTLVCPVGHPSSDGARTCPLCGRKYVKEELVVLPPTKEEALALWRAKRRAEKAAAQAHAVQEATTATTEAPAIPVARESSEALSDDVLPVIVSSVTWSLMPETVSPRLFSALSGALFVSAFALGESTMLSLSRF